MNYTGFGSFGVWVLEDDIYSTQAWYEKSTGLLINGSFQWFGGFYTFDLTATNMFPDPGVPDPGAVSEIPSFEIFLILPVMGIISFFILKRRQKNLIIDY